LEQLLLPLAYPCLA